jgi:hypothetical protein
VGTPDNFRLAHYRVVEFLVCGGIIPYTGLRLVAIWVIREVTMTAGVLPTGKTVAEVCAEYVERNAAWRRFGEYYRRVFSLSTDPDGPLVGLPQPKPEPATPPYEPHRFGEHG